MRTNYVSSLPKSYREGSKRCLSPISLVYTIVLGGCE